MGRTDGRQAGAGDMCTTESLASEWTRLSECLTPLLVPALPGHAIRGAPECNLARIISEEGVDGEREWQRRALPRAREGAEQSASSIAVRAFIGFGASQPMSQTSAVLVRNWFIGVGRTMFTLCNRNALDSVNRITECSMEV